MRERESGITNVQYVTLPERGDVETPQTNQRSRALSHGEPDDGVYVRKHDDDPDYRPDRDGDLAVREVNHLGLGLRLGVCRRVCAVTTRRLPHLQRRRARTGTLDGHDGLVRREPEEGEDDEREDDGEHDLGRDEKRVDAVPAEPRRDDERGDEPQAAREEATHDGLEKKDNVRTGTETAGAGLGEAQVWGGEGCGERTYGEAPADEAL